MVAILAMALFATLGVPATAGAVQTVTISISRSGTYEDGESVIVTIAASDPRYQGLGWLQIWNYDEGDWLSYVPPADMVDGVGHLNFGPRRSWGGVRRELLGRGAGIGDGSCWAARARLDFLVAAIASATYAIAVSADAKDFSLTHTKAAPYRVVSDGGAPHVLTVALSQRRGPLIAPAACP